MGMRHYAPTEQHSKTFDCRFHGDNSSLLSFNKHPSLMDGFYTTFYQDQPIIVSPFAHTRRVPVLLIVAAAIHVIGPAVEYGEVATVVIFKPLDDEQVVLAVTIGCDRIGDEQFGLSNGDSDRCEIRQSVLIGDSIDKRIIADIAGSGDVRDTAIGVDGNRSILRLHHHTHAVHYNRAMTRQVIFEHHYGKPSAGRALGFVIHGIGAAIPCNQLRKPAVISGPCRRCYPITCMYTLRDSLGVSPQPVAAAGILHQLGPLIYISAAVGDAVVL